MDTKDDRLICGSEKEEWEPVYYEPIPKPDDLTTQDLVPEVGLFSHSKGKAKENEPMFGQVAWEPFLNPDHFPSNSKMERSMLQKKILYDAWRYLVARDPAQVDVIRRQLAQGSQKQRMLLKALDKARKAKSNAIKQRNRAKAKKLQSKNANVPRKSIEKPDASDDDSDEDSGLGSDSDDDVDRWQMPPPTQTTPRRRPGLPYQPDAQSPISESDFFMSGGRGNSIDAESYADLSQARRSMSATSQAYKRKSQPSASLQRNVRARREERGLFITPQPTGEQQPRYSPGLVDDEDLNVGLDDEEAFELAARLSVAPGEDGNNRSQNAGSSFGEGFHRTVRESMPPEGGVDE